GSQTHNISLRSARFWRGSGSWDSRSESGSGPQLPRRSSLSPELVLTFELPIAFSLDQAVILVDFQVVPVLGSGCPNGPFDGEFAGPGGFGQAEDVPLIVGGHVAASTFGEARQLSAIHFQNQFGARQGAVVLGLQFHTQPVIAGRGSVFDDGDRRIDVTNHN